MLIILIADPEEQHLRQRFYNWHLANLEFANAASIGQLSVRTWDQDDPHELSGPHCFLPGTFPLQGMAPPLDRNNGLC